METVNEVRIVYNGTKSGLNDSVYVPLFSMPMVGIYLQSVKAGTYMSDYDVDEIILNFMLEPSVSPHAGVNLSQYFLKEVARKGKKSKRCWSMTMMRFAPSP